MDISTIGYCLPIVVICYMFGYLLKGIKQFPDKQIPTVLMFIGGIIGLIGMNIIQDFPATDYITAFAVGIFSGLCSVGVNQVYKQVTSK